MSPLVLEALKSLTTRVNLPTGLTNYSDESAAKEIFKLLYKEGEQLLWVSENAWKTKYAQQLGELSEKIGRGGRVVVRNKNQWREDIIAQLKIRASNHNM